MIRTQIQLDPEQLERVKAHAASQGISVAEVFRRSLECYLSECDLGSAYTRARSVVGRFSGPADLSSQHDRHLSDGW